MLVSALVGAMTCLVHVEIQPFFIVEPGRRPSFVFRLGMKAHQGILVSTNPFNDTLCHGIPNFDVIMVRAWVSIPSYDPNNIVKIFIAVSNPFSEDQCIFLGENFRSDTPAVFE